MINQLLKRPEAKVLGYIFVGVMAILSSIWINPVNHYINALILMLTALVLYFYIVIAVAKWNWLDMRAMFTAVWLFTLGLTALRLLGHQEQWRSKTWVLCAVGYLMFQLGTNAGILLGGKYMPRLKGKKLELGKLHFRFTPDRLFWICIVTTLIGLGCFLINVAIKGFIPCFEDDIFAYVNFYTKFHVFSAASTVVCGLCYYCIKTQPLSRVKKAILWLCIFYTLFLFPVLVVSRGIFVVAALAFTTVVFYLNKRKFLVLVLCIAVIMGVYMFTSNLRSFSDSQLNAIFDPNKIPISDQQGKPGETTDETTDGTGVPDDGEDDENVFVLPPKLAFLYGYLTVSHDNVNEAVKYLKGYTWGTRQLVPFNVILRQQWITDMVAQGEYYKVTPNFNTTNMMGIFYYDFHEAGVVVCMFLWSLVFGLLQAAYSSFRGPFSLMALGYAMSPVTLCFFSAWVDSFDLWMFFGVVLIFAFASSVHLKKKKAA